MHPVDRLAASLIRIRARRLPVALAARLQEEWLAELAHIPARHGRLSFAARLWLTRSSSFAHAATASDALDGISGARVLSLVDMRVSPETTDLQIAGVIDFVLLIALVYGGQVLFSDSAPLFWLAMLTATLVWVFAAHVLAVRVSAATPGQFACGVRVVTLDGAPLTWSHILRRACPILIVLVCGLIGLLVVAVAVVGASTLATLTASQAWTLLEDSWAFSIWMYIWIWQGVLYPFHRSRAAALAGGGSMFDHRWSGTTLVMKIPVVVGVPDEPPRGSTSAMR